jgi:glycosyltransferase involved in cell wall biosynthesis
MADQADLVSVGIPTYNRLDRLRRAVESVLDQDYPNVEVVVSDNASTDGTAAWMDDLAAHHPNVAYHRNHHNVGATANFNLVRQACEGELLMWLGDDDVLEPGYVSACAAALAGDPRAVMAAGTVRYDEGGGAHRSGVRVSCLEDTGPARVAAYYRQVADNGTFYGLTRRSAAQAAPPMANRMGNDWYLMAALAYQGRILAVDGPAVIRDVGGATRSLRHVAEGADLTWIEAEMPQLAIAGLALRDVAWDSPVYRDLGRAGRLRLGLSCAAIIAGRFVLPSVPKYLRLQRDRLHPAHRTAADQT